MRTYILQVAYWLIVAGGVGFFGILGVCWLYSLVALIRGRRVSDEFIRRGMNAGRAFGLLILFAVVLVWVGGRLAQWLR